MKTFLHTLTAVALSAAGWLPLSAQTAGQPVLRRAAAVTVRERAASVYEGMVCKHFQVEAAEAGRYHAACWLLPARQADGSYTRYSLYVNGQPAGTVTPGRAGWHQACPDGGATLSLSRGTNTITLATEAPEVPQVECVRLAATQAAAAVSSAAYDAYVQRAAQAGAASAATYAATAEAAAPAASAAAADDSAEGTLRFDDVPLKYSFYNLYTLSKGDTISISSQSQLMHVVDVFYHSPAPQTLPFSAAGEAVAGQAALAATGLGDVTLPVAKRHYDISTTDIQRINWSQVSSVVTPQPVRPTFKSKLQIAIPKDGVYMVKARSYDNDHLALASFSVRHGGHTYTYENVPIYNARRVVVPPAGSCNLVITTHSANPSADDPMLFAEGHSDDIIGRITGYSDDRDAAVQTALDAGPLDAAIVQSFYVPTSGVHVSAYGSNHPESTCTIVAAYSDLPNFTFPASSPLAYSAAAAQPAATAAQAAATEPGGAAQQLGLSPGQARVHTPLTLRSASGLQRLEVFTLTGALAARQALSGHSWQVSPAQLGITAPGAYLFRVTDGQTCRTFKVLVTR